MVFTTETAIILTVAVAIFALLIIIARILSNHIAQLYKSNSQLSGEAMRIRKDVEGLPGQVTEGFNREKKALTDGFNQEKKALTDVIEKKMNENEKKIETALAKFAGVEKKYENQMTAVEKIHGKLLKQMQKKIDKLEGKLMKLKGAVKKAPKAKKKPAAKIKKVAVVKPKAAARKVAAKKAGKAKKVKKSAKRAARKRAKRAPRKAGKTRKRRKKR